MRSAVAAGIAYLPRDRRATGIFPTQSVLDNFAISSVGRDRGPLGLIDGGSAVPATSASAGRLSIVAPRPDAPITTLSGGNQQKVLLARALALEPAVLLLNDPTRGVDVATRQVLYGVFRELAGEGMGLVILSTEIEEVLLLCQPRPGVPRRPCGGRAHRRGDDGRGGDRGDVRARGMSGRLTTLAARGTGFALVLLVVLARGQSDAQPGPLPAGRLGHAARPRRTA